MSKPNVLVLRAPGTNCDQETGYAFEQAGAAATYVHINQLLEQPGVVADHQILCLPGGFSYGDDIAAGRILASQMQSRLAETLNEFRDAGKLVLGICNGFQVLIKSGFLLPMDNQGMQATLTWNDSGRYLARWVDVKANQEKCVFLKGVEHMYLPIAHAEGKFVARTPEILSSLQSNDQLAVTYCASPAGHDSGPLNPNGSTADVAGVCDETGRIFGLMPHPERNIDRTHHPRWTRENLDARGDGFAIFENAVNYFA